MRHPGRYPATARTPASRSISSSSRFVYPRLSDTTASCRVTPLIARPTDAAHTPAMATRERRRSASTTPRRATRSNVAIQRTATARGRWCSTWLATITSTERAPTGSAFPSATIVGTPAALAIFAAVWFNSRPIAVSSMPRRRAAALAANAISPEPVPTSSRVPVSRFPFPCFAVRRTDPAPAPPLSSLRTARSSARCRGALSRPERDRRADCPAAQFRSLASAEAGVATAVVEQGPAVRDGAACHQAKEHGMIAARGLRLLLTLDAREYAFEHRDAVLGLPVADAVEAVRVVRREPPRDGFLVRREHVQYETWCGAERGIHIVLLVHRHENQWRLERHRSDRARRHPDRPAGRVARGQDGHARREATEQLAKLGGIDCGHIVTTRIGPGRSLSALGARGRGSRSRSPEDPRGPAAPPGGAPRGR